MLSISPNKLVDTPKAAEVLGLSVSTLTKWRVTGRGPRFKKLGAAVRYDLADLENFKEAASRISTSEEAA